MSLPLLRPGWADLGLFSYFWSFPSPLPPARCPSAPWWITGGLREGAETGGAALSRDRASLGEPGASPGASRSPRGGHRRAAPGLPSTQAPPKPSWAGPGAGKGRGRGRGLGPGRMNEAEGLRQRRPLRPQVITEDSPAQEAKEGRWGCEGVGGNRPRAPPRASCRAGLPGK